MKVVNRFEFNLLKILHLILERASSAQVLPLILREFNGKRPKCLSRDSVELVEDSLRKGCVSMLTKWGGWQQEKFLRNQAAKKGRIWERTSPEDLGLTFSATTLKLLVWLTNSECSKPSAKWNGREKDELTLGDQFFWYLVVRALRDTELVGKLLSHPQLTSNGLVALSFPNLFAKFNLDFRPDFEVWLTDCGGAILEAMQGELANTWLEIEQNKPSTTSARVAHRVGSAQSKVLGLFVEAANTAGRTDLYRFMLEFMSPLLTADIDSKYWTKNIQVEKMRIADRNETYLAALAVPVAASLLDQQNQTSSIVSYIDEEYEASQIWKENWEKYEGDRIVLQAERLVRQVSF